MDYLWTPACGSGCDWESWDPDRSPGLALLILSACSYPAIRIACACAIVAPGLSRRMVSYYESGEQEVQRTVLLALKGWEAERQHAVA